MRKLWEWLQDLDQVLRGQATRPDRLQAGSIGVSIGGMLVVVVLLGMIYGACMGTFAVFRGDDFRPQLAQLAASTSKVPALFLLTLLVTLPSLYVFNALVGSRLTLPSVVRLLLAALGVNLAVLASLGPITAFFSVSTTSYPFMVLFNVLIFAVSGALGLIFLLQTLNRLTMSHQPPADSSASATSPSGEVLPHESSPLDRIPGHMLGRHVKTVFNIWMVLFALVGAQMGWVLRPFIGHPGSPFEIFRTRESNFFEAVWNTLRSLLG